MSDLTMRATPTFKLKAQDGRNKAVIKLKDLGFIPQTIIIEQIIGKKNTFIVYGYKDSKND